MSMDMKFFRFEKAHEFCYEIALSEVKQGRKKSHWMWYIFPQIFFRYQSESRGLCHE